MSASPRPLAGLRYLAVSVLLFGGIWPVTRDAFQHGATPLWFALARAGLAALVATLLLGALGRLRLPGRADWPAVAAIGLLQLGGFFALTHLALDRIPAGRTAILSNVTIFWLVPLSALVLGERMAPRHWAAAALGLAGVTVLMSPWRIAPGAGQLLGYGLLLLASLAWSLAILATRRYPPRRPVFELLPWCFALGALLIAPLALLQEPAGGIGRGAVWQALFIGGVAAPIGTWATIEAGRQLSGLLASVGFLVIPAFGVVLSNLWLGEPLGWDVVAGGALILASVAVAARA
ncbi:MAG TPA: DMT family transporter [Crenalkalicoccus sp.]|nr:DMT family transporter [Crenalkalicoccus sp.]